MMTQDGQMPHLADINWLEPPTSPFPFRCLYVRLFCSQLFSTTVDARVADRFTLLRSSTGGHVMGRLPEGDILVPCDLSYPFNGNSAEGPLFKAAVMEDKWDIFLLADGLYFSRSWTGELVYKAEVRFAFDRVEIRGVRAAGRSLKDGAAQVACDVDFLMKSHLFRRAAPYLIPASLPVDDYAAAMYGFSAFGRYAVYAARDDACFLQPEDCPTLGKNGETPAAAG
jgi:hypothetical protein